MPQSKIQPKLRYELLLCPRVPKPLHHVAPRTILGDAWWDVTRHAAYKSTNYHCAACGVYKYKAKFHKWLEGHEFYSIDYLLGTATYIETVPLCHACHNFIHMGRLTALRDKFQIRQDRFLAIVNHGETILREAGFPPKKEYTGPVQTWGNWRLSLFGTEYPPKYKTYGEWKEAFK